MSENITLYEGKLRDAIRTLIAWSGWDNARRVCDEFFGAPAPQSHDQDCGAEDWRDDPSADDRWNAGCDFAMRQLCDVMDVDPDTVCWDAATETLDGDVQSVIWGILRKKMGEDWSPDRASRPAPADAVRVLVEALEKISEEHDVGRHDGLPEACPANDADVMFAVARAALSDPRVIAAQSADPWQPIASAPKDGTEFLAYFPDGARVVRWERAGIFGETWFAPIGGGNGASGALGVGPTHWMPLPTPPAPQPSEPT